jgi:hypothetical protein
MSPWFKDKSRLSPAVLASCPKSCEGRNLNQVASVSPETVGITPQVASAANLESSQNLLFCQSCGCVWRRIFDTEQFRFHDEVLGVYSPKQREQIQPESWLSLAISKGSAAFTD